MLLTNRDFTSRSRTCLAKFPEWGSGKVENMLTLY